MVRNPDVENGKKSKEDHNKYFQDMMKDLKKLSLKFHPDKHLASTSDIQVTINDTKRALNNIHNYIVENKVIDGRYGHVYRIFAHLPLSVINSSEELGKIMSIRTYGKLHDLAYWEEGNLMEIRNQYIKDMENKYIGKLRNETEDKKQRLMDKNQLNQLKKEFDQYHNECIKRYKKVWVDNLKSLHTQCTSSKELEIIKPEIEKLLKNAEQQYEILKKNNVKNNNALPDRVFVQPMLYYNSLMGMYYRLLTTQPICSECDTHFTLQNKEYAQKLLPQGLLEFAELIDYCLSSWPHNIAARAKLKELIKYKGEFSKEEIVNILIFSLDKLSKLLKEEFKPLMTFFDKKEINDVQHAEECERIRRVKEEIQQYRKQKQAIDEARQKAEELTIRTKKVMFAFSHKVSNLSGRELRAATNNSVKKIVEAVIAMDSPEEVLDTIMEKIKSNKKQIIKDGEVSDELLREVVLSSKLSDIDVSQSMGATTSRG